MLGFLGLPVIAIGAMDVDTPAVVYLPISKIGAIGSFNPNPIPVFTYNTPVGDNVFLWDDDTTILWDDNTEIIDDE